MGVETRRSEIQGHPGLHNEFKITIVYKRPCPKTQTKYHKPGVVIDAFSLALRRQMQVDLREFKGSLIYIEHSRTARAT